MVRTEAASRTLRLNVATRSHVSIPASDTFLERHRTATQLSSNPLFSATLPLQGGWLYTPWLYNLISLVNPSSPLLP